MLRQMMWTNTMTKAGQAFADLAKIPKKLVQDLQHLEY